MPGGILWELFETFLCSILMCYWYFWHLIRFYLLNFAVKSASEHIENNIIIIIIFWVTCKTDLKVTSPENKKSLKTAS